MVLISVMTADARYLRGSLASCTKFLKTILNIFAEVMLRAYRVVVLFQ